MHDPQKLEEVGNAISSFDARDSIVAKSFSHMLNLANSVEEVQNAHRRRNRLKEGDFTDENNAATESDIEEALTKLGVPKFLRCADTDLKNIGINERVPYNAPVIQFSFWMGCGRNGNPRVTPEVIRDLCLLARMMAANFSYSQIENITFELSMWRCNELRVRADEICMSAEKDAIAKHYREFWKRIPPNEPYRVVFGEVRDRLYRTRERSRHLLAYGYSDIPEEATFTNVEEVAGHKDLEANPFLKGRLHWGDSYFATPDVRKAYASRRICDLSFNLKVRLNMSKESREISKPADEHITLNPTIEYAPGLKDTILSTGFFCFIAFSFRFRRASQYRSAPVTRLAKSRFSTKRYKAW